MLQNSDLPPCSQTVNGFKAQFFLSATDASPLNLSMKLVRCAQQSAVIKAHVHLYFRHAHFFPMQVAFTDALKHKSSEKIQFNSLNNFENLISKNTCTV